MRELYWLAAAATLALLGACEAKIGGNSSENEAAALNAQASAAGKAQDGKLTIKAPGFDVALSIPEGMARQAKADSDSKIVYPGSKIGGIYVAAGENGGSEVEMRFATDASPDAVAAWYRDPARKDGFALESV